MDVSIRWLIRRDMPEVLAIEQASFSCSQWTEEDFLSELRQRNVIGLVAERAGEIVGFMIYELHKSRLQLLSLAVRPDCRRQLVGTQMVLRLIDKLSQQRRTTIALLICERCLPGQMFFKSRDFVASRIVPNCCGDGDHDGYLMNFNIFREGTPE